MKTLCSSYLFKDYTVRYCCKTDASEAKFVLEDILKILYPSTWDRILEHKIEMVRKDVATYLIRGDLDQKYVYIADPFVAKELHAYCDDAEDETLFRELGIWLDTKGHYLENDLAFVAETQPKFKEAMEYVARVTEEGKDNQLVTIDDWLRLEYEIELPWVRTPITKLIDLRMAHGKRLLTGEVIPKTAKGVNHYRYRDFGEMYVDVNRIIAGDTVFDNQNYKDKCEQKLETPKRDGYKSDYLKEAERTLPLIQQSKSNDEIIWELWRTSPTSSPHQYSLLLGFVEVVRERATRQRRNVSR